MKLETPYYLIDERKLRANMKKIACLKKMSGAKTVLALKCFSTWACFGLMKKYMDGTTSSSLYEAKLGYEKFGKETHAYCVAWNKDEIRQAARYADKIIFNSVRQLNTFRRLCGKTETGLRINPGISYSHFDLADPARKYSRLGVTELEEIKISLPLISGAMFHFNCENDDLPNLKNSLNYISGKYGGILDRLDWVSLGGGIYFTKEGYPLDKFARVLGNFAKKHSLQIYLEPGEAAITGSCELVTTVLDIVKNEKLTAVVDASAEAHMLDLIIYRIPAKIITTGKNEYIIAGRSCLAGDIFGTYRTDRILKPGDTIRISDAAGYTMVKKNWFNGLNMPSIAIRKLNGSLDLIRDYNYNDFLKSLS